jgi:hypothetical protein
VTLDHGLLNGVQLGTARDTFDRYDFATCQQRERDEAAIDGAIAGTALSIAVENGDRARAAITLGATFLGTRAAGAAKIFEQREVGGAIFDTNGPSIQSKLKGAVHIYPGERNEKKAGAQ